MVWGRERKKKVWVNQSHPVTSAGGTFLACGAWIKLTWARAQVPFPTLKGNLKYVNNIRGNQRKRNENNWRSGGAARGNGAESAGGLLMYPASCWAWAAPSLFSRFSLLKDTQEWFQQNPMGAQIPSQLQLSISVVVSTRKYRAKSQGTASRTNLALSVHKLPGRKLQLLVGYL